MSDQNGFEAFISYRRHPIDTKVAAEIQNRIEHYRIPRELREETGLRKFRHVFRDTSDLSGGKDLGEIIEHALESSSWLIVICSERTSQSAWVQREIEYFLAHHDREHVLTVLVDGEPDTVVPKILRQEEFQTVGEDGSQIVTTRELDPLSIDFRNRKRLARRLEFLRLAAQLLGCPFDALYQRDTRYRRRRNLAIISTFFTLATIAITFLWWSNREITRLNDDLEVRNQEISLLYDKGVRQQSLLASNISEDYLKKGRRISALRTSLSIAENLRESDYSLAPELLHSLEKASLLYDFRDPVSLYNLENTQEILLDHNINYFALDTEGRFLYCVDTEGNHLLWSLESGEQIWSEHSDSNKALRSFPKSPLENTLFITSHDLALYSPDGILLICIDTAAGEKLWELNLSDPSFDENIRADFFPESIREDRSYMLSLTENPDGNLMLLTTTLMLELRPETAALANVTPLRESPVISKKAEANENSYEVIVSTSSVSRSQNGKWIFGFLEFYNRRHKEYLSLPVLISASDQEIFLLQKDLFPPSQETEAEVHSEIISSLSGTFINNGFPLISNDGVIYSLDISKETLLRSVDKDHGLLWEQSIPWDWPAAESDGQLLGAVTENGQSLCLQYDADVLFLDSATGEIVSEEDRNALKFDTIKELLPGKEGVYLIDDISIVYWGRTREYARRVMPGGSLDYIKMITGCQKESDSPVLVSIKENTASVYSFADINEEFSVLDKAETEIIYSDMFEDFPFLPYWIPVQNGILKLRQREDCLDIQMFSGEQTKCLWSKTVSGMLLWLRKPELEGRFLFLVLQETPAESDSDLSVSSVVRISLENGDICTLPVPDIASRRVSCFDFAENTIFYSLFSEEELPYDKELDVPNGFGLSGSDSSESSALTAVEIPDATFLYAFSETEVLCRRRDGNAYLVDPRSMTFTLLAEDAPDPDFQRTVIAANITPFAARFPCALRTEDGLYLMYTYGGKNLKVYKEKEGKKYAVQRSVGRILTVAVKDGTLAILYSDGFLGIVDAENGQLLKSIFLKECVNDLNDDIAAYRRQYWLEQTIGRNWLNDFSALSWPAMYSIRFLSDSELLVSSGSGCYLVDLSYLILRTEIPDAVGYDAANDGFYLTENQIYKNICPSLSSLPGISAPCDLAFIHRYTPKEVIEKARQHTIFVSGHTVTRNEGVLQ